MRQSKTQSSGVTGVCPVSRLGLVWCESQWCDVADAAAAVRRVRTLRRYKRLHALSCAILLLYFTTYLTSTSIYLQQTPNQTNHQHIYYNGFHRIVSLPIQQPPPQCTTRIPPVATLQHTSNTKLTRPNSDIIKIICAVVLPPLGVFLERGCGADLLINLLLTVLGCKSLPPSPHSSSGQHADKSLSQTSPASSTPCTSFLSTRCTIACDPTHLTRLTNHTPLL
jgi:uncharacterized membrane protein YqaE (UPF0057 family)